MYIGKNIRYLRNQHGCSQEDLATYLGYKSYTTITKWESGVSEPTLKTTNRIAEFFHISVNELCYTDIENQNSTLTKKDTRDIEKILDQTREQLTSQKKLMLEGEPASPEAVDSILAAMQVGMEMAKLKNKEKYTPKKYKNEKYTQPDQVVSIVREPEPDYLAPDAAHSRNGADAADQEYDDKEIMDNDALWEK